MAGRHQQAGHDTSSPRLRLLIVSVVVFVLVAGAVGAFVLFRSPTHSATNKPAADTASGVSCGSGVALNVVAAEEIAPVVTDIANSWVATHPVIDGACPTVTVKTSSAATTEAGLAKPDTTLPDVWLPDSSVWVQQLRSDIDGQDTDAQSMWVYPAVASSPLVLATTSANQSAASTLAQSGWASVLAAPNVSIIDPTTSTDGLLSVLTAQSLLSASVQPAASTTASAPSRQYVNAMVALSRTTQTDANAAFLALGQPSGAKLMVVASEQDELTSNASRGATPAAVSVVPTGKALSLDFPPVQFAPPGANPAQRDAATALVAQLSTTAAQKQLRTAGLRDAAGNPIEATAGLSATENLDQPTSDQVADGLRVWNAAARESRTLLVIDVSGSMSDTIGGGQSKIQFAADAEKASIDFFPDTSSLGLWTFSAKSNPSQDWTQVVTLGPLASKVGTVTRRQALVAAAATLPGRTGGDTGLYNTVLGAYQAVRTGYDPAAANSVVLLTDGSNTQTAGIDLATLLSTLRSQTSSAAPLPIITIAVGKDADVTTLQQISAATGGSTLTAAEPADIRDAVLDALVRAG